MSKEGGVERLRFFALRARCFAYNVAKWHLAASMVKTCSLFSELAKFVRTRIVASVVLIG